MTIGKKPPDDPRRDDPGVTAPYARPAEPLAADEKPDQLADKEAASENRDEAPSTRPWRRAFRPATLSAATTSPDAAAAPGRGREPSPPALSDRVARDDRA